jgi:hypothetical protein
MELIENLQYGNEASLAYHYSYAAILVKVPPFIKRTTTTEDSEEKAQVKDQDAECGQGQGNTESGRISTNVDVGSQL